MKKLVILFAVLMLMSVSVFAGPYFSLENNGVAIAPVFTAGVDFSAVLQSGPRVFGDTNWTLPINDWDSSIGVGWAGVKAEVETLLDFNRTLRILNNWNTSFTITGYPFAGLKVWGGVSFNYDPFDWELVPVFGVEGRW